MRKEIYFRRTGSGVVKEYAAPKFLYFDEADDRWKIEKVKKCNAEKKIVFYVWKSPEGYAHGVEKETGLALTSGILRVRSVSKLYEILISRGDTIYTLYQAHKEGLMRDLRALLVHLPLEDVGGVV